MEHKINEIDAIVVKSYFSLILIKIYESSFLKLISSIAAPACIKLEASLILFRCPCLYGVTCRPLRVASKYQLVDKRRRSAHVRSIFSFGTSSSTVTQVQTANNSAAAVCAAFFPKYKKPPNSLCGYVSLVKPFNKSAGNVRTHAYIYSPSVQCIRCDNHLALNVFFIKNIRQRYTTRCGVRYANKQ